MTPGRDPLTEPMRRAMKTLRESLIAVLVVLAWVVVAQVADADLRARQHGAAAAPGAT